MTEIRKATINDIEEIVEIEKECFNDYFEFKDIKYEVMDNPFSKVYILILDKKIIGYIDFWITFDSATITKIAIRKQYQNKGYGTKLMEFLISSLKEEKEVLFLTLEVRKSNAKAVSFYEKFGFSKINVKKDYYNINPEDAIAMMKGIYE